MKRLYLALPLLALAAFCLFQANAGGTAVAQAPGPDAGELLADGFATLGGGLGPDGAFYVADQGNGGDEEFEFEGDPTTDEDDMTLSIGLSGSIIRVDPETGETTTVVDGLPSAAADFGTLAGVIDVTFIGETMYILLNSTGAATGFDTWPQGVWRVGDDGTLVLIADFEEYILENPVDFPDAEPLGNLFSITPRGEELVVVDANHNKIYLVDPADHSIEPVAVLENIVPTNTAPTAGPIYFSTIGPFPHTPETGCVRSVNPATQAVTEIACGQSNVIDVEIDGQNMYALSMGNAALEETDPAEPFSGKIMRVTEEGEFETVVDGFLFPISFDVRDDTAFVLTLTGELWRVDDLSTLPEEEPTATATSEPSATATTEPPTATPTTVPPTATPTTPPPTATNTSVPPTATNTVQAPRPPQTGSGSADGSSNAGTYGVLAGVLLLAAAGLAGSTLIQKRSK